VDVITICNKGEALASAVHIGQTIDPNLFEISKNRLLTLNL
jgi:hypothetical protein